MNENDSTENLNDSTETIEEVAEETTDETPKEEPMKPERQKRTPQEELDYHEGRAQRLRKKLGVEPETKVEEAPKKSSELDYGQKAFLRSYDIKGADELTLVKSELKRSGLELDELIENEYFQGKIKNLREAKATSEATPKGSKRSVNQAPDEFQSALSEYNQSGKLPEDRKLREKVVDAAIEQKRTGGTFSSEPVVTSQK